MADVSPIISPWCNSHGKSTFNAYGRVTLATAATAVTVSGAAAGDIVILSLEDDDSGTSITHLDGKITAADTLTINRTDDSSSSDDGVCSYLIIRP